MTDHTDKTAPEGEWIEWAGGENPVPGRVVDADLGMAVLINCLSDIAGTDADIIAYRLITPKPATTELSKNLGELNPAPAEGVGEREKLIDDLRHVYSQMTPSGLERMDSDGAAFIIERAIKFLAALSPSPGAELSRPITFQDVRLAVGEGKLTATDVLAGVNAELRRRAALSPSPVEKLVEALERQCDNMAFVVNHAPIIQPWYDKFSSELEEDRQSLAAARQTGEEDIHAAILVALSALGIGLIAAVIMSFVFMGAGL